MAVGMRKCEGCKSFGAVMREGGVKEGRTNNMPICYCDVLTWSIVGGDQVSFF